MDNDRKSALWKHWQRALIVMLCLVLVIVRLIWPTLTIDWISVVLVAIAALAILLPSYDMIWPRVAQVLPYVKKVKVAGVEVELTEEIRKLSKDVDDAKDSLADKGQFSLSEAFEAARSEVLDVLKVDPRAALMILAARIEQHVMIKLAKHRLREKGNEIPMSRAMKLGVEKGVFPAEVLEPFQEFWSLRNKVAHGQAFEVDSSVIFSLVSVGLDVLKLVSLEEKDGTSSQE